MGRPAKGQTEFWGWRLRIHVPAVRNSQPCGEERHHQLRSAPECTCEQDKCAGSRGPSLRVGWAGLAGGGWRRMQPPLHASSEVPARPYAAPAGPAHVLAEDFAECKKQSI